ncbi:segregation and condensation protein A [Bacillus horti]|uniref:Segregation and condensation protein A n=1 Tax=Caldalkalibacillus horti TaxID=77523 RepID=A0ABT9VU97_9BACI|nr:segregation/condensation protein A [Bacillus horti]MDQ0164557.1 segregation and condensation protein A [Bacillus horti]
MINVKVSTFEGPLDLLLHLIDKAEVDIYEISVAEITDQYMQYILQMQQMELDIASEFLVMASRLLAMKSRMLLPKKEELEPMLDEDYEELDPREELILRLIEYKKFKDVAFKLREKETVRSQIYTRPAEDIASMVTLEPEEVNPVANVSLFDLLDAFEALLEERKKPNFTKVDRDEISIDDRMTEIRQLIQDQGRVRFSELFRGQWSKDRLIVTFLALLELMKKKHIFCNQSALFGDIIISHYAEEKESGTS